MFKIILIISVGVLIVGIILFAILFKKKIIDGADIFCGAIMLLLIVYLGAALIQGNIESHLANAEFWNETVETTETKLYSQEFDFSLQKENNYSILEYINSTFYFPRENKMPFSFEIDMDNCSIDFVTSDQNKLSVEKIKYDKSTTHKFNKSVEDFPFLFPSDIDVINDIKFSEKIIVPFNILNSGTKVRYPEIADSKASTTNIKLTFYIPENTLIKTKDKNGIYIYKTIDEFKSAKG